MNLRNRIGYLLNEKAGVIASFAQKSGKTEDEVERLWKKAKEVVPG